MMMSGLSRYNHENSEKFIETKLLNLNGEKHSRSRKSYYTFFLIIVLKSSLVLFLVYKTRKLEKADMAGVTDIPPHLEASSHVFKGRFSVTTTL